MWLANLLQPPCDGEPPFRGARHKYLCGGKLRALQKGKKRIRHAQSSLSFMGVLRELG
jgi:hypothetical protein